MDTLKWTPRYAKAQRIDYTMNFQYSYDSKCRKLLRGLFINTNRTS